MATLTLSGSGTLTRSGKPRFTMSLTLSGSGSLNPVQVTVSPSFTSTEGELYEYELPQPINKAYAQALIEQPDLVEWLDNVRYTGPLLTQAGVRRVWADRLRQEDVGDIGAAGTIPQFPEGLIVPSSGLFPSDTLFPEDVLFPMNSFVVPSGSTYPSNSLFPSDGTFPAGIEAITFGTPFPSGLVNPSTILYPGA